MAGVADDGIMESDEWSIDFADLKIGEQVGKGAFGKVYRGELFGTEVAIKQILKSADEEETKKYVEREINILKGIRHPHVVNFMGVSKTENEEVYIITEWLPGGDLSSLMTDKSIAISWKRRLEIARDVAMAMNYLHNKKLIHRDLKAENLLLTENGRVKLADFGFARKVREKNLEARGTNTKLMTMAGTDDWMAPEVILGEDYDNKCDVYGFGVVLYELISRTKPPKRGPQTCFDFKEDDIAAIIPPDCPPKFSDLANHCCKYFSKDRPSFAEVLEKLKEIVEECKDDVGTASSAIVIPSNDEEDKKKEERKKSSRKKKKKEVKSPTSRSPKSPTISSASEHTTEKGEEEEVMGEMEVTSSGKLKPLVLAKKKPKKESAGRRDSKGKPRKSQPSPSIPASTSGTDLQGDAKKEAKKEHRRSWLVSAKLPGVSKASRAKSPRKATENEDGSYSPSSSSPSASLTRDARQGMEQDHQLSPKPRKDKDTTTNLDESNEQQAPHGEEGMTEEEAEFEQTPESLPVVHTSTLSEGNVTKESVEVSKKVYRSKKITMKLTKDVRAFSPGDAVLINVAVDNQTNKTISMITVQLERINYVSIEGKSKNKTLEKTKTETVTVGKPVNYFYTIGPSAKYDGSVEYLLPKDLTSSARGENETVSYSLIVTCVVKHAKDISTIFPIEVK